MAINVDIVYKTVLSILNKEQRGYMTPDEFNKVATQVQLEIFESYFEDLNQQVRVPQTDTEYADRQKNIDNEVVFSLFQMNKILDHMGLDYEDLYKKEEENRLKRNYLYREDTNVFAYYIVKTVLLYHYDIFLEWCSDKNYNLIDFKKTTKRSCCRYTRI